MQGKQQEKKSLPVFDHRHLTGLCLILCDLITIHLSYFLALWIRFDCVYSRIPKKFLNPYIRFISIYSIGAVVLFWAFGMC